MESPAINIRLQRLGTSVAVETRIHNHSVFLSSAGSPGLVVFEKEAIMDLLNSKERFHPDR